VCPVVDDRADDTAFIPQRLGFLGYVDQERRGAGFKMPAAAEASRNLAAAKPHARARKNR